MFANLTDVATFNFIGILRLSMFAVMSNCPCTLLPPRDCTYASWRCRLIWITGWCGAEHAKLKGCHVLFTSSNPGEFKDWTTPVHRRPRWAHEWARPAWGLIFMSQKKTGFTHPKRMAWWRADIKVFRLWKDGSWRSMQNFSGCEMLVWKSLLGTKP